MKKLLFIFITALLFSHSAFSEDVGFPLDQAPRRIDDLISLQRGVKLFVNYCLNCHSANEMRYSRLQDVGLSEKQIQDNLLFSGAKVGDMMGVAMRPADAKEWFGAAPPDLSVEARARNADWLYTYLRTFYRDKSRPTGWNNLVYPNVAMPHVLWELQGQRLASFQEVKDAESGETKLQFEKFKEIIPGKLSPAEYDSAVADLVNYMVWMSEPQQRTRERLGVWVLLFLGVFTLCAWRLNAAYWKDVK